MGSPQADQTRSERSFQAQSREEFFGSVHEFQFRCFGGAFGNVHHIVPPKAFYMTKTIAHTHPKTTRPKKKVGVFHLIEPGEQPIDLLCPMIEFRDHAIALVQHGSSWLKLYWEPEPSMMSDRHPDRINTLATAFLNQPSTILLKGPLRFSDNTIYGPAYVLHRTALMPYHGPIVICEYEKDLFGAKLRLNQYAA
jgi:hypothetical protein